MSPSPAPTSTPHVSNKQPIGSSLVLFFLNFYLARRLIVSFNLRMSLWGKTIVESCVSISIFVSLGLVFLLNAIGDAIFVFKDGGSNASAAATLAQSSAILLLLFDLAVMGSVLGVRISTDRPHIPRLGVKMVVLFVGAGLFTIISHLVRLASTFHIWKASTSISDAVLSKPLYYVSGIGLEILILILYATMRIDLLFSSAPTLATTAPSLRSTSRSRLGQTVPEGPLRLNPVGRRELSESSQPRQVSLARATPSPAAMGRMGYSSEKERSSVEVKSLRSDDSQEIMFIEVHRTFSISSQRVESLAQTGRR